MGAMNVLHNFLSSNREEPIRRCPAKVSRGKSRPVTRLRGDTGAVLEGSLARLRDLIDRSLATKP